MNEIQCSSCQAPLGIPEGFAEAAVRCPRCGGETEVEFSCDQCSARVLATHKRCPSCGHHLVEGISIAEELSRRDPDWMRILQILLPIVIAIWFLGTLLRWCH
jgi:DNA-directed RNA polymerase subunit RPC12/RpoP